MTCAHRWIVSGDGIVGCEICGELKRPRKNAFRCDECVPDDDEGREARDDA